MFKSLIELNKSNSWVLITTFYVLIRCVVRNDPSMNHFLKHFLKRFNLNCSFEEL